MTTDIKKASLEHDPIVEALFEIRFVCNQPAHLLPGVIYPSLRKDFPKTQVLEIDQLPAEIRDRDPNLRYATTQRFIGDQAIVNVGPRSFNIASPRPYLGWDKFKPIILQCLKHLLDTGFIDRVERYSLRYVNLFSAENSSKAQFSKIYFSGTIGKFDLTENQGATQINTEIQHKGLLNRVSVSSRANANIQATKENFSGLLLDIDTIDLNPPIDFLTNPEQYIEIAHEAETDIFFGTATKETLIEYGYKDE